MLPLEIQDTFTFCLQDFSTDLDLLDLVASFTLSEYSKVDTEIYNALSAYAIVGFEEELPELVNGDLPNKYKEDLKYLDRLMLEALKKLYMNNFYYEEMENLLSGRKKHINSLYEKSGITPNIDWSELENYEKR